MDDIDRTFLKLKRKPLIDTIKQLREEGKLIVKVDSSTFIPIAKVKNEDLQNTGWTINEVTGQTEAILGYKVWLEDDWVNIDYDG